MNTATPKYTVDYFIKKFEAIPDNKWCIGRFKYYNRHCAFGHCGVSQKPPTEASLCESSALRNLFEKLPWQTYVVAVNDGQDPAFPQTLPKARILAALQLIKDL